MLTVGITGSFGTGKSTVAEFFAAYGAKIINADAINHALIRRGGACFKKIISRFGKEVLTKGDLDRRKLAKIVFSNPRKLETLCRIVYPAIVREIKRRRSHYRRTQKNSIIIIDAPLLIEAGLEAICDYVVVVKASPKQQIERLKARMDIEEKEIVKRIKAQMPLSEKLKAADIIIDNSGPLTQTKKEVKEIWQKLQKKK